MVGSIPHAIAYGMYDVLCIGIPYDHMTMSHNHLICFFEEKRYTVLLWMDIQHRPHLNISFQPFNHQLIIPLEVNNVKKKKT